LWYHDDVFVGAVVFVFIVVVVVVVVVYDDSVHECCTAYFGKASL
jgi:hypothetical protein